MNKSASPSRTYVYVRAYATPAVAHPGDIAFVVYTVVVRAEDVRDEDWEGAAYALGGDLADQTRHMGDRVFNDIVYQVGECGTVSAHAQGVTR